MRKIISIERAKVLPENGKCLFCKSDYGLQVHHVNEDRKNNEYDNLLIACRSCHKKLHIRVNDVIKKYGINSKRLKQPFSANKIIRNIMNNNL